MEEGVESSRVAYPDFPQRQEWLGNVTLVIKSEAIQTRNIM